jgi:hypothetical protein
VCVSMSVSVSVCVLVWVGIGVDLCESVEECRAACVHGRLDLTFTVVGDWPKMVFLADNKVKISTHALYAINSGRPQTKGGILYREINRPRHKTSSQPLQAVGPQIN